MTSRAWLGPRGKGIVHTGSWSLAAKVATASNLFLTIPFVLKALGPIQFGAWATLVSLAVFAGFLDFGFSNGTMNLVAAARGRGAQAEIVAVVREGRKSLLTIAAVVAACSLVGIALLPWHQFLGLPATSADSSRLAAAYVVLAVVLAIPLNLANRVQLGLGRGDRAFRWQFAAQLLTLVTVVLLARGGATLPVLTAAAVAMPLLGPLATSLQLMRDPIFKGVPQSRRMDLASQIRHEGLLFFVLQLCAALAFATDLPLISLLHGPADAGTYAIVQRLFSIIPLSLGLIWAPLWPVYREALASGNRDWVVRTLQRSIIFAVAVAVCGAAVLVAGFDYIVGTWVQRSVEASGVLIGGFAAWCVLEAVGTSIATFFNAASVMRYQVIVASVFAVSCFGVKFWAIYAIGMEAAPWATVIVYALTSFLPTMLLGPRLVRAALTKTF